MTQFNRRTLLKATGLGLLGASASGWGPLFARHLAESSARKRHVILLWMPGGPSQLDTFDPKSDHANGGEFKPIETSVSGVRISEHLPKLAQQAQHLAICRGMTSKEGDHGRATYLVHTGYKPGGPIRYPALGSAVSKALGDDNADVPNYVSVGAYEAFNRAAFSPGFLGPRYAALNVAAEGAVSYAPAEGEATATNNRFTELRVADLRPRADAAGRTDNRLKLWNSLEEGFLARHKSPASLAHHTVYQRAVRMMRSSAAKAFDLSEENEKVREAYGRGTFGQGCLLARRLVEAGVPFVEVALGSFGNDTFAWDTHLNNFPAVRNMSAELDAGWSTLMSELAERGLLESTTILWAGEFGRTPKINDNAGRDHFPNAWSAVLAGGGIRGGQAYGRTSADGMQVEEGQMQIGDLLATLCQAVGVDPETQNVSEEGRPIRIVEGKAVPELLA